MYPESLATASLNQKLLRDFVCFLAENTAAWIEETLRPNKSLRASFSLAANCAFFPRDSCVGLTESVTWSQCSVQSVAFARCEVRTVSDVKILVLGPGDSSSS